ncbi:MAG: ABC-type transport auxiliary lipoprotein family protein [Pseudomonadota bacterium]
MRQTIKLTPPIRAFLLASGLSFALGGCVSVLPELETPNALYEIQATDLPGLSLAQNVIVREPETVRIFAGESIVTEASGGGLILVPSVEWAGPSTQILQLALLDALNSGNGQGIAVTPSAGSRAPYELDWRINDLSLRGDTAICELHLILLDGTNRDPVERFEIRETVSSSKTDGAAKAKALSEAAEKAVASAAQQIANRIGRDA